jgi:muconate cycloisomerase
VPKIEAVEVLQVRVPRRDDNRITTSYATLPDAHHAIVRVHAEGLTGIGEAPAELWWTGEDAMSVSNAIERYLAPALVGRHLGIRQAAARMDAALAANPYAKAAIEMALWDLLGKAANRPLHVLVGGGPPLAVPVKYTIGMVEPARAANAALAAVGLGFTHVKVKVGGDLAADLARLRAVREAIGDRIRLGVDANGGWSLPVALQALPALQDLSLSFLEQPVSADFPDAMAAVTAHTSIPVVAHESLFTRRDAFHAAKNRLAHIWAVTPSTHGGLVATLDILGIAQAAGIPCLIGSTVELGVASAFMAQIAAAFQLIAGCPVPSDIIGSLYHESDITTSPLQIEGGLVEIPSGPGLGVELDSDRIAEFRVGPER